MSFPVNIPRTSKPPIGTGIDWSNPLSQGLVGCWLFNEGGGRTAFDLRQKGNATLTGAVASADRVSFNGTNASGTFSDLNTRVGKVFTIFYKVFIPAYNNNDKILLEHTMNFNGRDALLVNPCSSSGFYDIYTNSGPNINGGMIVRPATGWHTIGFNVNRSVGTSVPAITNTVMNGKPVAFNTTYASPLNSNLELANTYIASRGASSLFLECALSHLMIYNRALSATEIRSLHENPYQICQPETMWVDLGGAGGGGSAIPLATAIANSTNTVGTLSLLRQINSLIASASNVSAVASLIRLMNATTGNASNITPSLDVLKSLSAALSSQSNLFGSLDTVGAVDLVGTLRTQSDVQAVLSVASALTIRHKFTSSLPDSSNSSLLQPSHWNQEHDIEGLLEKLPRSVAPESATASGTAGEIAVTDGYLYLCVAANTWKRWATDFNTW